VKPRVFARRGVERERDPDLVEGNQCSHYRRPQAAKQKDTARGGYHVLRKDDRCGRIPETGDTEIDQSDSEASPEEEQANTGPATRKG
jgi:hypothetical protein